MSDIRELLNIGGGQFVSRMDVSPGVKTAWRLLFEGETEQAEGRFRKLVADDGKDAEALAGLAICVAEGGGRFVTAEKLARMAVHVAKRSPAGYLALGFIHMRASRLEEGYGYLMKAQNLAPRDPRLQAGLVWYQQERPPVIIDLAREHPLNRTLGAARDFLDSPAKRAAAAIAVGVGISLTRALFT
jgi:tetratricopeptide (TPR) repeat protein